jgi:hypothetical protein
LPAFTSTFTRRFRFLAIRQLGSTRFPCVGNG